MNVLYIFLYVLVFNIFIILEPYEAVMDILPSFCPNDQDIWRTKSPLICVHFGEWHLPGWSNNLVSIPSQCNIEPVLHDINMRTTYCYEFGSTDKIIATLLNLRTSNATKDYIIWYNKITIHYITRPALVHLVFCNLIEIE